MPTPTVLATADGALSALDDKQRCWRALSWVPGRSYDTLQNTKMAAEAGQLVARWHLATADLDHDFVFRRPAGHNTPVHMDKLRRALSDCTGHRLWEAVHELAESIFAAWARWDGSLNQRLRLCHGDLKISNLRFTEAGEGLCLLDLDTLAMLPLDAELGDAWRSWCNPAGESNPDHVYFDIDLFESSARAWAQAAPELASLEKQSMAGGIERICLELSARFCADTINNNYFKENLALFPQKGQHNYIRALGQYKLAQSAKQKRSQCESILRSSYKEKK